MQKENREMYGNDSLSALVMKTKLAFQYNIFFKEKYGHL